MTDEKTNRMFYTVVNKLGDDILCTAIDTETGKKVRKKFAYKPILFHQTDEPSEYKSLNGLNLTPREFDSIRDMSQYLYQTKEVSGLTLYGMKNPIYQFISEYFPNKIEYDTSKISGAILDIEVFSGRIEPDGRVVPGPFPKPEEAKYPISSITVYSTITDTYYAFGLERFDGHDLGTWDKSKADPVIQELNVEYLGFQTERELINAFLSVWKLIDADWYSGWNSDFFDIAYLYNRIDKVLGEKKHRELSPWGFVSTKNRRDDFGNNRTSYDIMGIQCLDMCALFKKHGFINPINWKLGTVASDELGTTKLDYTDEGSLTMLYVNNFQKYLDYNIIDVSLVKQLNDRRNFIDLTYEIAYLTRSNYTDTLDTVPSWYSYLYHDLKKENKFPEITHSQGKASFPGGFVMVPLTGKRRWIVNGDFNSLYPHLMQQYNIGPETIIPYELLPDEVKAIPEFTFDDLLNKRVDLSVLKKYNIAMTANRQFYRRDVMSCFSKSTRTLYDDRAACKRYMKTLEQEMEDVIEREKKRPLAKQISALDTRQHSLKILKTFMRLLVVTPIENRVNSGEHLFEKVNPEPSLINIGKVQRLSRNGVRLSGRKRTTP